MPPPAPAAKSEFSYCEMMSKGNLFKDSEKRFPPPKSAPRDVFEGWSEQTPSSEFQNEPRNARGPQGITIFISGLEES